MKNWIRVDWLGLLGAVVVGVMFMAILYPAFLTEQNLYVLLRGLAVAIIVGFTQMITLSVGELNLSVGALGGLMAVSLGLAMEGWGLPIFAAILLILLLGILAGLINGLLVAATGINGFIITLATGGVFTGINLGLTEAVPFYKLPPAFVEFGNGRITAIPYIFFVTVIVAIGMAILLGRTVLGRQLLAFGGNRYAAELSGISGRRALIWAHAISGGLVAIAAILAVAQLGSAQPTIGAEWVLASFAAPIIGGAVLTGGYVSVMGTVIAAGLVALIQNGLVLAQADPFWVQFLLGVLILGGVGLGQLRFAKVKAKTAGS
jgi:ribose transport system permease protein